MRADAIHLNARIFAVADAYDAITSDRPYRAAATYDTARTEIMTHAGRHFDPAVVKAFLDISESEWHDIRVIAESQDYIEHIIDKREIRSFILSLKSAARTGPLQINLPM